MATPCLGPEVVDKGVTVPFIIQTRTLLRGKGGAINNFSKITVLNGGGPRQTGMDRHPLHRAAFCSTDLASLSNHSFCFCTLKKKKIVFGFFILFPPQENM